MLMRCRAARWPPPRFIDVRRNRSWSGKTLVTGVIGSDTHIVGNRILSMALEKAGYKVVALGALTPAEEFVKAAVETAADAILVSSLYGQGELDCRGFRDLCVEAGLEDILIYVGGNLVVGKQPWEEVERRFVAMGFDRAFPPGTRTDDVIRILARGFRGARARMRPSGESRTGHTVKAALLIDFGSTYTKLRAVDVERASILGAGQGPSTVGTDITIGMRAALADLERHIGALPSFAYRLACSSAAGGLRMVTVGLVRELDCRSGRGRRRSAPARAWSERFAYRLTTADVGPDRGARAGHRAAGRRHRRRQQRGHRCTTPRRSAASRVVCPIVLAGNRSAMDECRDRLARAER